MIYLRVRTDLVLAGCLWVASAAVGAAQCGGVDQSSRLSVSASPSSVSFVLSSGGTSTASSGIAVTLLARCMGSMTTTVYGYFTNASSAMSGATSSSKIVSSSVYGRVSGGVPTTYTSFTQSQALGTAGATLELLTYSGGALSHIETDVLTLQINLSSQTSLPADTYTGTLFLQAQAF